jgi:hypothetical protein|tara:strand:- start:92 stop:196 length:105 start_codon:yes stop_codon:yes gene_type:complete
MKWESVFARQELKQMITVFAKQMVMLVVVFPVVA